MTSRYVVAFPTNLAHFSALFAETIHITEHTNVPSTYYLFHPHTMAIYINLATLNQPYGLFMYRLFLHCFIR